MINQKTLMFGNFVWVNELYLTKTQIFFRVQPLLADISLAKQFSVEISLCLPQSVN